MDEPSEEQNDIVSTLKTKKSTNLRVNSVAGSGKTTTVLHLAKASSVDEKILLLTYNARLKIETREKAVRFALHNLEVHSYHSFGVKYYLPDQCFLDAGLRKVVEEDLQPRTDFLPLYSYIVIDEAQDMTPLLCDFVMKVLKDHYRINGGDKSRPQIAVIGDELQSVYAFKEADSRYLTMAEEVFGNDRAKYIQPLWESRHLRTSFRVSGNIARFVNEALLGCQKIVPFKEPGDMVDYYVGSPWYAVDIIMQQLMVEISLERITPSDIFVLAPSLKANPNSKAPLKLLENKLAEFGIPVFIPSNDDAGIKDNLAANKVVFSTFHQSKGLERKIVIVFGCSKDYFTFYARDADPRRCPPTIYVAATRAISKLIVIAESKHDEHMPFIQRQHLNIMNNERNGAVRIKILRGYDQPTILPPFAKSQVLDATELLNFLPDQVVAEAKSFLRWTQIVHEKEVRNNINLSVVVDGDFTKSKLPQQVAELNGLAIPAMLECKINEGKCQMYSELENATGAMHCLVEEVFKALGPPEYTHPPQPDYFLRLAAAYTAGAGINRRGYISTLTQLARFDWIDPSDAAKCVDRLESAACKDTFIEQYTNQPGVTRKNADCEVVSANDLHFEYELKALLMPNESTHIYPVVLAGRADIVTPKVLWEIKCTKGKLQDVHFLQLAIYAWIWKRAKAIAALNAFDNDFLMSRLNDDDAPMLTPETPETNIELPVPESEVIAEGEEIDNDPEISFRLFNVLSGEMWELHPDCMSSDDVTATSGLDQAVNLLIRYYYRKRYQPDDKAFLQRINGGVNAKEEKEPFPKKKDIDIVDLTTSSPPKNLNINRSRSPSQKKDSMKVDLCDDDFFDLPIKPSKMLKLEGNLSSDPVSEAVFALANNKVITNL
mmetsp:Transcript_31252/g.44920  ORF Transcript_31252/g.44920 Transcript_31252/m.44920 type:complete len:889 (-) Transcript_31252:2644-5310(-)